VDVDKFDYILRDCFNVGLNVGLDPIRLMKNSYVINNEICFNQKEAFNLYQLFYGRFSLFKQVYTHRVSCAIECIFF
jgi:HD superfamily phosphohydrolase